MKKATILLLTAVTLSLPALAQPSKWFVSVSSGIPFGGPAPAIKNNMIKSGLDNTSTFAFLFLPFSTSYPTTWQNPPLLLKLGKRITNKRSLYVIAGISNSGNAEGYKATGYDQSLYPLFGGSYGLHVHVKFHVLQAGAGYQYSYAGSRAKVAIAPSLFLFNYQNTSSSAVQRHTAIVPGMAFTGRLPLGKERHLVGVDLVAELNLAPPVKMKELYTEESFDNKTIKAVLNSNTVNMVHGMVGLACSFRKK